MSSMITKLRGIVWLHTIRLWRYGMSFLNMILSEVLWVLLFMLGVLLFVPPEHLTTALRMAYWTIAAWTIISSFSSLVGGWTNFFIMMGMVEEHILRNTSPFTTILGRILTGTTVSFTMIIVMGYFFSEIFGRNLMIFKDPMLMILAFALLIVESLSYALSVSATSMRTSISEQFLEILNFGIIGILIIPIEALPTVVRTPYLLIPYVAPTYLIKAAIGSEQPAMIGSALLISAIEAVPMMFLAFRLMREAESYIRRNGVRAIGFW